MRHSLIVGYVLAMQHIPPEIVCLGINPARPAQDARRRPIMKIQISQSISTNKNLYTTASGRYLVASSEIFALMMPS